MQIRSAAAMAIAGLLLVGACSSGLETLPQPEVNRFTQTQQQLLELPTPSQKVAIAVYSFTDLTGQFKASSSTQTLSRAVTQGPSSILVQALHDAGGNQWFDVVERENLEHLLNERQIISQMRERYLGETQINPDALPPLVFAGILLEGGIVSYDTNIRTGGAGARFLGIGASTEYREDTISVYLRAVSTKSGTVLASVTTSQRMASIGIAANAFRFVSFKELLEVDAGITVNQPTQLAVQQAIEKCVYALIMEGQMKGLWSFADATAGQQAVSQYLAARGNIYPSDAVDNDPDMAEVIPEKEREPAPVINQFNSSHLLSGSDSSVG